VGEEKTAGQCIALTPQAHRRTTDNGKRRGGAGRAEGGSGDRGGRRLPGGPEWPGGPNATWAGAERKQKECEMGRKYDSAEMILGCAEKKKKVFRILIQGMIFKSKF
jgi:hypothetical protein